MNSKKIFVTILIFAIAASTASAACADRKEGDSSDFIEDAKCSLSKAKDTVSEGFSDLVSNDKVQNAVGYISNKTSVATDVVKDAASKTGSFLGGVWDQISEKSKTGYAVVKDFVQGKKESEYRDGQGQIDVRMLDT